MDKLFNCNFVLANFKEDADAVVISDKPCEVREGDIPISWKHNYNTGKTTIYIHSRKKLSEFEENAIKGYVMARCYPEMFENWLQEFFGQK